MSLPCRWDICSSYVSPCPRDIGSSYVLPLSVRHIVFVQSVHHKSLYTQDAYILNGNVSNFPCLLITKIYIYICSYNRLPRLFNFEGVISHLVVIKSNLMMSGRFVSLSNFRYSNQTQINDIFEIKWIIWSTRTKRGSIIYLLSISSLSLLRSHATHHF